MQKRGVKAHHYLELAFSFLWYHSLTCLNIFYHCANFHIFVLSHFEHPIKIQLLRTQIRSKKEREWNPARVSPLLCFPLLRKLPVLVETDSWVPSVCYIADSGCTADRISCIFLPRGLLCAAESERSYSGNGNMDLYVLPVCPQSSSINSKLQCRTHNIYCFHSNICIYL